MKRRHFISAGLAALSASAPSFLSAKEAVVTPVNPNSKNLKPCPISLAQWSLRGEIYSGRLKNEDFPVFTKNTFGISAVEYVSGFFKDKAKDKSFLTNLKQNSASEGVTNVLIMVDGEGAIGHQDISKRAKVIDNHKKWVEAAQFIGCHTIRVNAHGSGSKEDQAKQATEGLRDLSTFALDYGINVVAENHGGLSSDPAWLSKVISDVKMDNCGTLPDFGNFGNHDRYDGIKQLMPFAKGVSAKCIKFDNRGNVLETDFDKAIKIVLDQGFKSWIGIEWGGSDNSKALQQIAQAKTLINNAQRKYFG